jgi:hypothetical protein
VGGQYCCSRLSSSSLSTSWPGEREYNYYLVAGSTAAEGTHPALSPHAGQVRERGFYLMGRAVLLQQALIQLSLHMLAR